MSKQKFAIGDTVWAVDNGKLYKSKILNLMHLDTVWKFFIHYQGWQKKYDIWMDENNLAAFTPKDKDKLLNTIEIGGKVAVKNKKSNTKKNDDDNENENEKSDDIIENEKTKKEVSTRVIVNRESLTALKHKRKFLAGEDLVDEDCGIDTKILNKIPLPLNLKKHLVDEWSLICGAEKRLIDLPRKMTLKKIIEDFLGDRKEKCTDDEQVDLLYIYIIYLYNMYMVYI